MTDSLSVIDLDAARKQRAAEREGKQQDLPIIIEGATIAVLPVELPVDVFAPLQEIDESVTLMVRTAMQMAKADADAQARWDGTELLVDLLAATPTLPTDVLRVINGIASNLLGVDGLAAFLAARPTREDLAELAKGVFRFYGLTMGESSASSDSSTDSGRTSNGTSSDTSGLTPVASGTHPVTQGSSEPAAS